MKVCTDSCIFGAWVSKMIEKKSIHVSKILDVGTGTGLLSLMIAQKTNAQVEAIDIDKNSLDQAISNFKNSKWNHCITTHFVDLKNFKPPYKFDLVICNPPFFKGEIVSPKNDKNLAKHESELSLKDFFILMKELINENGKIAILIPFNRANECYQIIRELELNITSILKISQTENHDFFRIALVVSKKEGPILEESLIIKVNGTYTPGIHELLKDYYLHLD